MLRQVMTAAAAVALLAVWVGAQPAQAKDWPNGYDPMSGLTWEQDFTYNAATNPFGSPPGAYARPDFFFGGDRNYSGLPLLGVPAANYYYGYPAYSYAPPAADYSYGAYAPSRNNVARIRLVVPEGAKVWFDGKPTQQSGTVRNFESPALTPGRDYGYDVKVQWRDKEGKEVTRTRHLDVSANANVNVDFTRAQ